MIICGVFTAARPQMKPLAAVTRITAAMQRRGPR